MSLSRADRAGARLSSVTAPGVPERPRGRFARVRAVYSGGRELKTAAPKNRRCLDTLTWGVLRRERFPSPPPRHEAQPCEAEGEEGEGGGFGDGSSCTIHRSMEWCSLYYMHPL